MSHWTLGPLVGPLWMSVNWCYALTVFVPCQCATGGNGHRHQLHSARLEGHSPRCPAAHAHAFAEGVLAGVPFLLVPGMWSWLLTKVPLELPLPGDSLFPLCQVPNKTYCGKSHTASITHTPKPIAGSRVPSKWFGWCTPHRNILSCMHGQRGGAGGLVSATPFRKGGRR